MTLTITLAQFLSYLNYLGASVFVLVIFITAYVFITPSHEFRLIKEGCMAAALTFGGAVVGFCLTLASSIKNTDNLLTFMVWALCSAVVQLIVYFAIARLIPNAREEIEQNNMAMGGLFFAISLAIGIVNAACLS